MFTRCRANFAPGVIIFFKTVQLHRHPTNSHKPPRAVIKPSGKPKDRVRASTEIRYQVKNRIVRKRKFPSVRSVECKTSPRSTHASETKTHQAHTLLHRSQCGGHFYAVEGQPLLGFKVDKEPEMPIVTSSNHVESLFLKKAHRISDENGKKKR